jgi:hypothetical protein
MSIHKITIIMYKEIERKLAKRETSETRITINIRTRRITNSKNQTQKLI